MFCRLERNSLIAVTLLGYGLGSCGKQAPRTPPRYAIVRFENLSGDPALEWMARGTAEYLTRSLARALDGPVLNTTALARSAAGLGAEPSGAPGASAERTDALAAGATRLISGSIEKAGSRIRVAATEEDLVSHKTVRIVTAMQPGAFTAIQELAREIAPSASRGLTRDGNVLRLYSTSLEEPFTAAVSDLEKTVQHDPDFGPAWVALVNAAQRRGDRSGALDLIAKAATHKLDPLDRANLDLLSATLKNERKGRVEALKRVAALSPGDAGLLRSLGELESAEGQFAEAAKTWKKLEDFLPNDTDALNQMGYNRAWSGDYPGALEALKQYAQQRPADPNPLDSTGDVQYIYRKFSDAAASYLQANAKNPEFQSGGDLYKAAWAQFRAGDKAKADATFAQFRAVREKDKADAGILDLFNADWLYRTGRTKDAVALLRKSAASPGVSSQLAIWDLLAGDRAASVKDLAGITQIQSAAVLIAKFVTLPTAAAAEWKERSERSIHGAGAETLRRLALGYALVLDGKKEAARSVWQEIVDTAPATDFFSRAVLA
ncbi:MAG TPA: tetratricopeptide repeat protein, partial [Bryobacteraceae bacterium]|nr:tetratricopeptide repeat protein [Bryobacteraceae bacterium]